VCARFIPRDQFRLLIGFIVKEQAEKENLIIGTWLRYANAKDALRRATGFRGLARQKSERFDPSGCVLSFGIARRILAQIKPGTFWQRLRSYFGWRGQGLAQSFLRAYAADRSEEDRKNSAN
jgi:hypothetical protein